ncbi:MAG: cupin domain-containing protein [Patescibacteria group bacterium]
MKIISQKEIPNLHKPDGTKTWYYLFNEYEIHYNEISPKSTQPWHHHEKIQETLLIIEGSLVVKWKIDNKIKTQTVKQGGLIEFGVISHTVANRSSKKTKFICFKQVLSGKNKRELLKTDKIVDE